MAQLKLPRRRLFTLKAPVPAIVEMNDAPYRIDLLRLLQR